MKTLTLPISFYSDDNDPGSPELVEIQLSPRLQDHLKGALKVAKRHKFKYAVLIPAQEDIVFKPYELNLNDEPEPCQWPHPSIGPAEIEFNCSPDGGIFARIFAPNGQYIETEPFSIGSSGFRSAHSPQSQTLTAIAEILDDVIPELENIADYSRIELRKARILIDKLLNEKS